LNGSNKVECLALAKLSSPMKKVTLYLIGTILKKMNCEYSPRLLRTIQQ
jgi:hypothetical protein